MKKLDVSQEQLQSMQEVQLQLVETELMSNEDRIKDLLARANSILLRLAVRKTK